MGKRQKRRTKVYQKVSITPTAPTDLNRVRSLARGIRQIADDIITLCDESLEAGQLTRQEWTDERQG